MTKNNDIRKGLRLGLVLARITAHLGLHAPGSNAAPSLHAYELTKHLARDIGLEQMRERAQARERRRAPLL